MAILLALSFSVAFAGDEKVNATTSMNTTTNITMLQNMTNVTNETTNLTNATNSFAKAKGAIPITLPKHQIENSTTNLTNDTPLHEVVVVKR